MKTLEAQLRELLRASGHSRIPVTRGADEAVAGLVSVKDFLDLPVADRDQVSVAALAKPVLRVPETAPLAAVVEQMRRARTQFAVAADEFGADIGILTLEDIVAELVGEVHVGAGRVREASGSAALQQVPGSLHLREVARRTGVRLPDGDYDTLAGAAAGPARPSTADRG